jgi:hypothetical protein
MKKLLSILIFKFSSPRRLILSGWMFLFTFFISIIGLNLWVDPYFIFRKSPFEPRMELINSRQRFAKSLQVITRQPHTIVLGSSRVYRGFDVKGGIYNMGISSLTLTEAAAYIKHILRFTGVRKIVLGLDFWMCDKNMLTQVDWDGKTGTFPYILHSFLNTLLKPNDALNTLKPLLKSGHKNDSLGAEEGWTYEGFYHTGKRSKKVVDNMLQSYQDAFEKSFIDLKLLSLLERIIYQCQSRGVKLYVYISPLHPATKAIYMKSPNALFFTPWRENIQKLCENNKIPFYDFTDFLKDSASLSEGSTEDWLDYSHFSPKVGRILLRLLGILE